MDFLEDLEPFVYSPLLYWTTSACSRFKSQPVSYWVSQRTSQTALISGSFRSAWLHVVHHHWFFVPFVWRIPSAIAYLTTGTIEHLSFITPLAYHLDSQTLWFPSLVDNTSASLTWSVFGSLTQQEQASNSAHTNQLCYSLLRFLSDLLARRSKLLQQLFNQSHITPYT